MFEKEAEEYVEKWIGSEDEKYLMEEVYKDGAEFGYNKANEWHYMKDVNCYEDLPQDNDKLYIWKVDIAEYKRQNVKPKIELRCGTRDDLEYDIMDKHVICFKEIVPPKESEA